MHGIKQKNEEQFVTNQDLLCYSIYFSYHAFCRYVWQCCAHKGIIVVNSGLDDSVRPRPGANSTPSPSLCRSNQLLEIHLRLASSIPFPLIASICEKNLSAPLSPFPPSRTVLTSSNYPLVLPPFLDSSICSLRTRDTLVHLSYNLPMQ